MMTQEEIGTIIRALSLDTAYKLEEIEISQAPVPMYDAKDVASDTAMRLGALSDMILGTEVTELELINYPLTPNLLPKWVYSVFEE